MWRYDRERRISEGGKQSLYALITPLIESRKLKTVTKEQIREIVKSTGIAEAIDKMNKTDLGVYLTERFHENISTKDLELFLWRFLSNEVYNLYENLPVDAKLIMEAYLNRYDVLNVKATLRKIMCVSTEQMVGVPLGFVYQNGKLDELLESKSKEKVCDLLNSLSMESYVDIIEKARDRINLELALEDEYFSNLLRVSEKIKDEHVSHFLGVLIDLTNVTIVLRNIVGIRKLTRRELLSRTYMLSSKEVQEFCTFNKVEEVLTMLTQTYYSGLGASLNEIYMFNHDILLLENLIEGHLSRVAKDEFLASAFTPAHILGYILLRENEVRLVLMALKVVEEQVPYDACARYFLGE